MQKIKHIVLLIILGITLFPWQMVCIAHPLGHTHHKHDEPSPCEIRRQYKGEESVFWSPMECNHLLSQTDVFEQPEIEKIKPAIKAISIFTVLFDSIIREKNKHPFLLTPDPKCRSATRLTDSPFRGPPTV